MVSEKSFLIPVTPKDAHKFLDICEKKHIPVGLITEWGACIGDNPQFIVELSDPEIDKFDYIATPNMLQTSSDGVFVRLKKDDREHKLPEFSDVFKITEL